MTCRFRLLFLVLACVCLGAVSCVKKSILPELNLDGDYVCLEEDGKSCAQFYRFQNGKFSHFQISGPVDFCYFENGTLWGYREAEWEQKDVQKYSVIDGVLMLESGAKDVSVRTDTMYMDKRAYPRAKKLEQSTYLRFQFEPSSLTIGYASSSNNVSYSIDRSVGDFPLRLSTDADWISNLNADKGKISFSVSENSTGSSRSGKIDLVYGIYARGELVVTQTWSASELTTTPSSQTVAYSGGSFSFDVAVSNPREGVNVTASSQTDWITDVQLVGNQVSYKVAENNTSSARTGTIRLTYGDQAAKDFKVSQTWSASELSITPSSQTVAYSGGSFSFEVAVSNPREGVNVTGSSQTDWITDIKVSGNTVSFKAPQNSSYFSRSGIIKLAYGSYAAKEYTVNQPAHPITSFQLNYAQLNLLIGKTETLRMTTFPEDVPLVWSSDKTSVATVSQEGLVTAVSNGTATITVKSSDNARSATCTVTVTTAVTGVSLNKGSIILLKGSNESLTSTISPATASNKEVTWSSSNTSVASVSQSGVVSALSSGQATITVTTKDGGKTSACTVVVVSQIVDLSSSGSSNCYIVPSSQGYKFKTVKGNSSTSVGSVASAEVLWESFGTSTQPKAGDIISCVSYASNYISFATPPTLKNGNAVIAAKNASGEILWSWHIWVCSGYDPVTTGQTYYNNAGVMMDRNLGATSATPGDVGALGLLYQWGRKDPFLGSSSILSSVRAASSIVWPEAEDSDGETGTIEYVINHPMTFKIYWCSSSNKSLWGASKTIYDPCPFGWKIPSGELGSVFKSPNHSAYMYDLEWDNTGRGINFSGTFGDNSCIWYPDAGQIISNSLKDVGGSGYWWTCTMDTSSYGSAYFFQIVGSTVCQPYSTTAKSFAFSVRCQKE